MTWLALSHVAPAWAQTRDYGDWAHGTSPAGAATSTTYSTRTTSLRLGATVDAETSPTANTAATGDGADEDGVTVPLNITPGASVTIPVFCHNSTGSPAFLNAWIDFDNNGSFNNATIALNGERLLLSQSVPNGTTTATPRNITFTVPASASIGSSRGVRVRLSSTNPTLPTGAYGNGEVEDYVVNITAPYLDYADWNGAGASSATTTSTVNSNLRLGAFVDAEASISPNDTATADGADDDGVSLPSVISPGASVTVSVSTYNNTSGNAYLSAWIDFNGDGTFNNSLIGLGGERLESTRTVAKSTSASTQNITFTVPGTASIGLQRGARFRLTSVTPAATTGDVGTGEVEDYTVNIATLQPDCFRLTALNYNTGRLTSYDGTTGNYLGILAQNSSLVNASEIAAHPDGSLIVGYQNASLHRYDAISGNYLNQFVPTGAINFVFHMRSGPDGNLYVADRYGSSVLRFNLNTGAAVSPAPFLSFASGSGPTGIGFDRSGNFYVSDSTLKTTRYAPGANTGGTQVATFSSQPLGGALGPDGNLYIVEGATIQKLTLPTNAKSTFVSGLTAQPSPAIVQGSKWGPDGNFYAVNYGENKIQVFNSAGTPVRTITTGLNGPCGIVFTACSSADFGDLPLRYPTLLQQNGPHHLSGPLRLGTNLDIDADGNTSIAANGDDTDSDGDDEDGITIPTLTAGSSASVTVNSSGTGKVNAFFDWNNNGSFTDSGEAIAQINVVAGNNTLTVPVPANAVTATSLGARFRLSTAGGLTSVSGALDGEVEDYLVSVNPLPPSLTIGNLVWNDANNDGFKDSAETGINGVTVQLFRTTDLTIGNADDVQVGSNVTTSGGGLYSFSSGVTSGANYYVKIPTPPAGLTMSGGVPDSFSLPSGYAENDQNDDNNGIHTTGMGSAVTSGVIYMQSGTESTTDGDSNSDSNLTIDFGFTAAQPCPTYLAWPDWRTVTRTTPTAGTGWISQPLVVNAGYTAQTFSNVLGTGTAVTISYTSNMFDAQAPNIYVPRFDPTYDNVNSNANPNDVQCNPMFHGAIRFTNNTGDTSTSVTTGVGSATGHPKVEITFDKDVLMDDFQLGSIGKIGNNVREWAFVRAYTSTGVGVAPISITGQTISCEAVLAGTGPEIINNGAAGAYLGGLDDQNAATPVYGNASFVWNSNPIRKIEIQFWRSNGTSTWSSAPAGGQASAAIRKLCFRAAPNLDYGDWAHATNPSGAATTTSYSTVSTNLRLGASVDSESSVIPSASANADDSTGSDDEDGVTMPSSLTATANVTIPVTVFNNSGSTAYLNAWIDFNNDGVFNDTLYTTAGGERLLAAQAISSSGAASPQNITFTMPQTVSEGLQRGARFIITNQAITTPTGAVGTGEIEDYAVRLCPLMVVCPAINVMPVATQSAAYSLPISAVGGVAPYTYSVTSSSPPTGITLNASTGVLSGTPTTIQTSNFTVTITDSTGCAATRSYTLQVVASGSIIQVVGGSSQNNVPITAASFLVNGVTNNQTNELAGTTVAVATNSAVNLAALTLNDNGTSKALSVVNLNGGSVTNVSLSAAEGSFGVFLNGTATSIASSGITAFQTSAAQIATNNNLNHYIFDDRGEGEPDATGEYDIRFNYAFSSEDYIVCQERFGNSHIQLQALDATGNIIAGSRTVQVRGTHDWNTGYGSSSYQVGQPYFLTVIRHGIFGTNSPIFGFRLSVSGADCKFFGMSDNPFTDNPTSAGFIGDRVWEDINRNGLQDPGESGVNGVTVRLLDGLGTLVSSTNTDSTGLYSFTAVAPGNYMIEFFAPSYKFTTADQGSNDGADSDANVSTGRTAVFTMMPCDSMTHFDAGLYREDFGDLLHPTASVAGFATASTSSFVSPNLRLGASVDSEPSASPNSTADADDTTNTVSADDEDGVTMPSSLIPGTGVTIPVSVFNNNTSGKYLQAWIDFNNDGSFNNANLALGGERIQNLLTTASSSLQSLSITFTVPLTASVGSPIGARFRLSDAATTPTGTGIVGEIEDYVTTIQCAPFAISPASLPNGTVSSAYSQTLTSSPALADKWEISAGSLPPGLSIANTGLLSGTPTTAGTFTFTVSATDQPALASGRIKATTYNLELRPGDTFNIRDYLYDSDFAGRPIDWSTVTFYYEVNPTPSAWNLDNYNNGIAYTITAADEIAAGNGGAGRFDVHWKRDGQSSSDDHMTVRIDSTRPSMLHTAKVNPMPLYACFGSKDYTIIISPAPVVRDFGDWAHTTNAAGAAATTTSSIVDNNLRLGSSVDAESSVSPNSAATADDTTNTGSADDEDGVNVPTTITAGASATITANVHNATTAAAYLHAWIDFNNDGSFNNALISLGGERLPFGVASYATIAAGTTTATAQNFTFTVPAGASTGALRGIRFRLTNSTATAPTGAVGTGEVEDYVVNIAAVPNSDFGDWSGSGAQTTTTSSIVSNALRLGATVDAESSVTPNATATADGADEDGLVGTPILTAGATNFMTFIVTNTTGASAYLNVWIDFNNDGDFGDSGERPVTDSIVFTGTSSEHAFVQTAVPGSAVTGTALGMRTRLTTTSGTAPTGSGSTGEVEDYTVTVQPLNPWPCLQSVIYWCGSDKGNDAYAFDHGVMDYLRSRGFNVIPGIALGASLLNADTATVITPNGADLNIVSNSMQSQMSWDDAGVRTALKATAKPVLLLTIGGISDGGTASMGLFTSINANTPEGSIWIENAASPLLPSGLTSNSSVALLNNPALVSPAGNMKYITYGYAPNASASIGAYLTDPPSNASAVTYLRYEAGATLADGTTAAGRRVFLGFAQDGASSYWPQINVNDSSNYFTAIGKAMLDKALDVAAPCPTSPSRDFGDWNGSGAQTTTTSSTVNPNLRLGALVDAESSVTPSAAATTDDSTGSGDEDSIATLPPLTQGQAATLTVNVTNTTSALAYLSAWIDYNNDGTFGNDATETLYAQAVSIGTSNANVPMNFIVPSDAVGGNRGLRVRLSSDPTMTSVGASGSGEVEDYIVSICRSDMIQPEALGIGNVGTPYSQTFTAQGAISPLTWTFIGSAIPGLSFNPGTATLSGTPTTAGTYPFRLTLGDSAGCTDTNSYTLIITNGSGTICLDANAVALGTAGRRWAYNPTGPPYEPGLSIKAPFSNYGVLAGTSLRMQSASTGVVANITYQHSSIASSSRTVPGWGGSGRVFRDTGAGVPNGNIDIPEPECSAYACWTPNNLSGYQWTLNVTPSTTVTPDGIYWEVVYNNVTFTSVKVNGVTIATNIGPAAMALVQGGNLGETFEHFYYFVPYTTAMAAGTAYTITLDAPGGLDPPFGDFALLGCPNTSPPTSADFGDFLGNGNILAWSDVLTGLRLGDRTDVEGSTLANASATGDDANNTDDEDGVAACTVYQGYQGWVLITTTNTTGSTAYLNAWADWNNNGTFDTAERILSAIPVATGTSNSTVRHTFSIPSTASLGDRGLRVTLTNSNITSPTGSLGSGEVEDHLITVAAPPTAPWSEPAYPGDLIAHWNLGNPGTNTGSTCATNLVHSGRGSVSSTTIASDAEVGTADQARCYSGWDATPSVTNYQVLRADLTGTGGPVTLTNYSFYIKNYTSIADPVRFDLYVMDGTTVLFSSLNNCINYGQNTATGSWLEGFKTFALPNIQVANNTTRTIEFHLRCYGGASGGTISLDHGRLEGICGPPPPTDFGDLPDTTVGTGTGNYQTLSINNGPGHLLTASTLRLGATVDAEANGQPNLTATGDGADEDGIVTFPAFVQGSTVTIAASALNNTGSAAKLYGFIDWNGDGDFGDALETLANVTVSSAALPQNIVLSATVPTGIADGNVGARFRLTSDTGLTALGMASNGEVEDYLVSIISLTDQGDYLGFEYADAAPTTAIRLGTAVTDAELPGLGNATATGDDTSATDDEDGASVPTSFSIGVANALPVIVTNTSGAPAFLSAWVDFNNNNILESNEQIIANVSVANGSDAVSESYTFNVPSTAASLARVGVRVRLSSIPASGPAGYGGNGEVEDYTVKLCPPKPCGITTLIANP